MNHRNEAFEKFYADMKERGVDVRERELMRASWEAGRRYEVERIDSITRWSAQARKKSGTVDRPSLPRYEDR